MRIGYAQALDGEQTLDLQVDALKEAGCDRIFVEKADDAPFRGRDGPAFSAMWAAFREGDILVVWRLDSVGRSALTLISLLIRIEGRGIEFQSLVDDIDTTTTGGRSLFQIIGALDSVEQSRTGARTKAGLHAAKKRGKRLGRPPALTPDQVARAQRAIASRRETVTGMAAILGVNRSTLQRAINAQR